MSSTARSSATGALDRALAPLRTAVQAHWAQLAPRERRLVSIGAAVLGAGLLWAVALAPAWRTLREVPPQREALEQQLQQMQALATEAQALRAVAPVPPEQAQAALAAAAQRLGAQGKLTPQGGQRALLTLQGASGVQLAAFLSEARAGARTRVIEGTLNQTGPGSYDGTLMLAIGGER